MFIGDLTKAEYKLEFAESDCRGFGSFADT